MNISDIQKIKHSINDNILIDSSLQNVFNHFIDNSLLAKWWPQSCAVEPYEGGFIKFTWFNGTDVTCKFLKFKPNIELSFTFYNEQLKFYFSEENGFTKVIVEHSDIPNDIKELIHIAQVWSFLLANLKTVIEMNLDMRNYKQ